MKPLTVHVRYCTVLVSDLAGSPSGSASRAHTCCSAASCCALAACLVRPPVPLALALPHSLPPPTPTACRANSPEASVSISTPPPPSSCAHQPVCVSVPGLTCAASLCPQSHCLPFPRCSPPFVLRRVLPRALVAAATRPVCFLDPIPTVHTPTPSTVARTSCALLPSTAPPSPWPARYTPNTSNCEAMSSNCAHGRSTVPC